MVCGRTAHSALVLRTDEGEIVVPGPVHTDPMAIAAPFDLVFVAVKTTQTEAIAPWLTALCSPDTVVCVLQNGVEQRQQFAPLTGGATVLPSVVWFPAQRDADASVWLRATPRLTRRICRGQSGCSRRWREPAARWTWRLILPPWPGANCCRTRLPV